MVRWEGGLGLYTDYMQRPYLAVHGAQEEPRSEGLSGRWGVGDRKQMWGGCSYPLWWREND